MRLIDADNFYIPKGFFNDGINVPKMFKLLKMQSTIDPATLAPKWISVEERLPEPDVDVLARCYYHERWQTFVCHLNKKLPRGWFTSVAGQWVQVTHWMPLPDPPKREGENDGENE